MMHIVKPLLYIMSCSICTLCFFAETLINSVDPKEAKQYLEKYYHNLALKTENRLRADSAGRRAFSSNKSKAKRNRCSSFNSTDNQRNKMRGGGSELVRETSTHIRRMSVDVGLFFGQKGLAVMNGGGQRSREPSPSRGTVTKETIDIGTLVTPGEHEKQVETKMEEKVTKRGGGAKKKGSWRLKRSSRLGSAEEENQASEVGSSTSPSMIPRSRQGRFRSSLKKSSSDDMSGMAELGSTVSMVSSTEVREKLGGGRGKMEKEKKPKFSMPFPRRQRPWKPKTTDAETENLSSELQYYCPIKEEGGDTCDNATHGTTSTSPTSLAQTGDSLSALAPDTGFSGHTPSPTHKDRLAYNTAFTGHTHNKLVTKHTSL